MNYLEHFLEAMLFFKKSEQEKKVGTELGENIQDILAFHVAFATLLIKINSIRLIQKVKEGCESIILSLR
jgi:hypothetical protein